MQKNKPNKASSGNKELDTLLLQIYEGLQESVTRTKLSGRKNVPNFIDYFLKTEEHLNALNLLLPDSTLTAFLRESIDVDDVLNEMDARLFDIIDNQESINWGVFDALSPEGFIKVLLNYQSQMPDEVYWHFVSKCYASSSLAHQNGPLIEAFLFKTRKNHHLFMNQAVRDFVESLPDKITIYRGCSLKEIKSGDYRYSWTLNKETAEFFAKNMREIGILNAMSYN